MININDVDVSIIRFRIPNKKNSENAPFGISEKIIDTSNKDKYINRSIIFKNTKIGRIIDIDEKFIYGIIGEASELFNIIFKNKNIEEAFTLE